MLKGFWDSLTPEQRRELALEAQSKRRRQVQTCEYCGQEFSALRQQRYCSPGHRLKAWREEKRKQSQGEVDEGKAT